MLYMQFKKSQLPKLHEKKNVVERSKILLNIENKINFVGPSK